jgi:hypothetical protein
MKSALWGKAQPRPGRLPLAEAGSGGLGRLWVGSWRSGHGQDPASIFREDRPTGTYGLVKTEACLSSYGLLTSRTDETLTPVSASNG